MDFTNSRCLRKANDPSLLHLYRALAEQQAAETATPGPGGRISSARCGWLTMIENLLEYLPPNTDASTSMGWP